MSAYESAEDLVSIREERGQVETARRALEGIERYVAPARMLDLGAWTGSFMFAARARGWSPVGLEPSEWARSRAVARGLDVRPGDLFAPPVDPHSFGLVVLGDVLEHVREPVMALTIIRDLLEPGGALYLTIPNAGSTLARTLGRRWWSVLPMHLQYFTPSSVALALTRAGFSVLFMSTHAKVFSARYYAERLAGYSDLLSRPLVRSVELLGVADRLVAPNFGDRLAVLAMPK
ncbi:MAG TPA: class I SAM-dependent methyltransferase [Candidatus Solibacter sp.]|jgi:SAM-dependent methyltransferase|nr:class I SAM-dependent methyltransferase [Candidatus Solibacter sp.]